MSLAVAGLSAAWGVQPLLLTRSPFLVSRVSSWVVWPLLWSQQAPCR